MSVSGKRILEGARQALAFARGEMAEGFVVHITQRIDTAELLSRFDPEKHRHTLKLDGEPVGTETKAERDVDPVEADTEAEHSITKLEHS